MRIGLRTQIFLWYSLVVPILIVGLAFAAQQILVEGIRAGIDDRLQERTELVASAITSSPERGHEGYDELIEWLTEQELPYVPAILRISDPRRNVLATFGEVPDPLIPLLNRQLRLPQRAEGSFETIKTRGHAALRLYTIPVYDPSSDETIALLQTGDSLAQVAEAQRQLWRYTVAVGMGGSVIALLVGFFILRRGFRPLDRILNRVQEIGTRNLATQIPQEPRPPELQQLADTLNGMLRRLDTAFKTREMFIAGVSHDLRTPLTVLQGQIEVMLMQPWIDKETRQNLKMMDREVRRLARMTNNLLLSAQLESAPAFTPGEVDLRELLDEVAAEARVLSEGMNLMVSIPETAVVSGDYDLLKQMVLNVVDNAIRFTPKGGSIELALSQQEGWALISVSDTGQGIAPEHLAQIGKPFYKADTTRKSGHGGAGLGLSIVKQILDLHEGQMEIHSQEAIGTTVTMRLPLRPTQGQ